MGILVGAVIKWLIIAILLTITQTQFFVAEREVFVANLRKTKLISLCVLAIIVCIQHTLHDGPELYKTSSIRHKT